MKPVLRTLNLVSLIIVFGLLFSSVQPAFAILQLEHDGHERRDYSSETGKLTFLGAEPDRPITVRAAQERGISAEQRSMAMVEAYGSEFGLKAPAQELMLKMKSKEGGREITRYQQTYQGIPVMGGELVVNATERGELLSMNGEISPDLDISVTPLISRDQAQETALAAVAKWNQLAVTELQVTEPELWIYDSRLLEADGTLPALVWRMDVFSADGLLPIRELVLVDAQRGHIALHFNQLDTVWQSEVKAPSNQTQAEVLTDVQAQTSGNIWYVATTGNNANSCSSFDNPCLTIMGAIGKAVAGDTLRIAGGTYTGSGGYVVVTNKDVTLSGGWNADFTLQTSETIIDGQSSRIGLYLYNGISVVDHLTVQNGTTGIFLTGTGSTTVRNVTVKNNRTGMQIAHTTDIFESAIIQNHSTAYNMAGGLYINGVNVSITNSTISGNSNTAGTGGIFSSGTLTIKYSTITNNTGSFGSYPLFAGGLKSSSTVILYNTILAGNTGAIKDCYASDGAIYSYADNILGDMTSCSGNFLEYAHSKYADPMLGPLSNDYHFLLLGSPAIDAGDSFICPVTDQRGVPRPQGAACDIGAFEFSGNGTIPAYIFPYDGALQIIETGKPALKNLKAFVLDANGDGVPGKTVTFTAPGDGASATFADTSTNVSTSVTDANGLAISSVVSANNIAGSYTVQVTVTGVTDSANFQLTNADPSLPAAISLVSGSGQAVSPQKTFSQPLKVKVSNYLGQPLSGITVTYAAPASGASVVFASTGNNISSAVTDASGVATSAVLSANNLEGSYAITATASGLADPVNFQLSNAFQQIKTYTANSSSALPGTLLCDQSQPSCTNGTNPDADAAHRYAFGTYNFYTTHHDRNSIDNVGMAIPSTVDYCDPGYPCPYANAFWSGTQMVYGDGYPAADDIVAHELTHGVTQYESNLFYYYQSGAINESFSDIWGELYDQSNGQGTDTLAVKWLIGEDVPGGAFRSMSNPPAYNDPDAITSPSYFTDWQDNGGVHTNSGVNNKAAFLLVDGGTFNGKTVTALGVSKTLDIYYEAQVNLLTSGADYGDLYNVLYQACFNLISLEGITAGDCQEVRDATDAVAMNAQPISNPNFNTDAPLCETGKVPGNVFFDELESGRGNWTFNNTTQPRWQYGSPNGVFAHSGTGFLYADDFPATITDATSVLKPVAIPANAYLHFYHAYGFEYGYNSSTNQYYYFDGGVLEYSTDSGTWRDAEPLMVNNVYGGTIYPDGNNPLYGRKGFIAESHGYISTRLNLSSLAGQTVSFRWRMGLDDGYYYLGWFVDDVRIYTCVDAPETTITAQPSNPAGTTTATFSFISSKPNSTFECSLDGVAYATCVSPTSYTGLSFANHSFAVRAIDEHGTMDPTPALYSWLIQSPVTIRGTVGGGDAALSYVDGVAKTVTTDGSGNYAIIVPYGWSGTVTPSKAGYGFIPGHRSYSDVTQDLANENYAAMALPGDFNKTSPENSAADQSLSPIFSWQPSSGATSYEYCYSSAPGPCTKWNSVGGDTSVTLNGLAPNYTYYWQVRAVNTGGTSEADSGTWWSFTTATAPVCTWPTYTPPISATFGDVPMTVGHWNWVERLANSTVTAGCGNGNFCPLTEVNRAQMAIFLLRSKHCGSSYTPPAVGDSTGFGDVSLTASYAAWVKQLAAEGITAGCGNGNFCPQTIVNRAQMAIFLLRAKHGATYSPPAVGASAGFGDVSLEASFAPWVKQLAAEGVTSGCGGGNFCPLQNVNRAQMATFLVRAFGLP